MKLLIAALAATILVPAAGRAQTKEEAVAYAFLGLADNATLSRATTTMSWKETSNSPAVFEGDGNTNGHKYHITFTVAASSDCDYEITLEGPPQMVRQGKALFAKIDLRKINGVSVAEHAVKSSISGDGFCETGPVNPACMFVDATDLFGSVDLDRHKTTVDFIRNEVCDAGGPK
jgi:hypothetical protein